MSADRLPCLPLPLPSQAYSSGTSSPRLSSISSSVGTNLGSQSSFTSAASSNGPKTPSPTLPVHALAAGPPATILSYDTMNPGADMYYPQHMSAGQPPPPQAVTSGAMNHYQLTAGHPQYSPAPAQYSQYSYTNGLTSPPTAATVSNHIGAPQNVLPLPGVGGQGQMSNQYAGFDTTGQQAPPGMKPRVTATLWEDEGSLCFQVEARGICVARREDNHMINGTKLLNVAGMTRGRRDGILKSEKVRHVVKIGPMHLKGVWIPYERALDFANKEKITEMLYPLFVHNIGALLYHPNNQSRTNQVMAAAERRKQDQGQMRNPPPPGLPSIQQHHHHPMALPGPQPSLPSQSNVARPPLDRSHTFPTPLTSASSVMGSMGASEGFSWQGQGMNGAQATTPPSTAMTSMQPYSSAAQGYDGTRQMYNAPATHQSPYHTAANGAHDRMYGPAYPTKSEMGPPSSRPAAGGPPGEQHDNKSPNGILTSETSTQHQAGDEEADHDYEAEYTHDSGAYDASRTPYNYTAPSVGALSNDGNMPSAMTGSPNHPPASGRATPRTTAPHQPYYPQHTGYSTPPRVPSSSNLFSVAGNERAPQGGASGADVYAPPVDMTSSMASSYGSSSALNGSTGGLKRSRDDDEIGRSNDGPGGMGNGLDLKRRKTLMDATVAAPVYDALSRPASAIAAPPRR